MRIDMGIQEKTILSAIKESVQIIDPGARIILFGSRARGDSQDESDWDILIITDQVISRNYKTEVREGLYQLQLNLEIAINSLFRNRQEWSEPSVMPVDKEIKKEGVWL